MNTEQKNRKVALTALFSMLDSSKDQYTPLMDALTQLVEASERGERFSPEHPLITQARHAELSYMGSDWSGIRQDTLRMFRPADMFIKDMESNIIPSPERYKELHDDFLHRVGWHPSQGKAAVAAMMAELKGGARPAAGRPARYTDPVIAKAESPEPTRPVEIAAGLEALLPRLTMYDLLQAEPAGSTEKVQTKYEHQQTVAVPFYRNVRLLAEDLREHETSRNMDTEIHNRILVINKLAGNTVNQEEFGVKTDVAKLLAAAREDIVIAPEDISEGLLGLEADIRATAERRAFKKAESLELADSLKRTREALNDGHGNALGIAVEEARSAMRTAPVHTSGSLGYIRDDLEFYLAQCEPKRSVGPKSDQAASRPPRTINRSN